MYRSTARPLMTGAINPETDDTMVAAKAIATRPRRSVISGARRLTAVVKLTDVSRLLPLLSLYGFVIAGASLGVIDLHVLRARLEQLVMRARGEHFPFHDQDDLVVVFDRRNLLRHGHERERRIVPPHVRKNHALGGR